VPVSSGGTLLGAEQTFHRLDAPELLADIVENVTYINGLDSNHGQVDEVLSQKAHLELSTPRST
jgi:hypothetical protein